LESRVSLQDLQNLVRSDHGQALGRRSHQALGDRILAQALVLLVAVAQGHHAGSPAGIRPAAVQLADRVERVLVRVLDPGGRLPTADQTDVGLFPGGTQVLQERHRSQSALGVVRQADQFPQGRAGIQQRRNTPQRRMFVFPQPDLHPPDPANRAVDDLLNVPRQKSTNRKRKPQ